jgi:transposase-like protein
MFTQLYGAKFPKAVKKITDDAAELLAFYDFPPSTGSGVVTLLGA